VIAGEDHNRVIKLAIIPQRVHQLPHASVNLFNGIAYVAEVGFSSKRL